ncbi:hypothetical protein ACFPYI_06180 [Halomarina salina]|uniref:Major facilitator superfamily (MFS) profile domain-containing protein n=1 Tax=Halomarina salina TaxID=1872699 RepID=A0ABD5RJX5_9EURY|nr:hypothetical protein [Halomarina salina]
MSGLMGLVLLRTILVSTVVLTAWLSWRGYFLLAGGMVLLLGGYVYLSLWGGRPAEERYVREAK